MSLAEEAAALLEVPVVADSAPAKMSDSAAAKMSDSGPPTLDIPASSWVDSLFAVREKLGCAYFDWLSAVDELSEGFSVVIHVARLPVDGPADVRSPLEHILIRTRIPRSKPVLDSATAVYAGAAWHEREAHEMFGIDFAGHPGLDRLLLPEEFEGHPLRKEFVLAARVAKPWPGAKEPGESDATSHRSPSRRRLAPPGVPSPDDWGPRRPDSPGTTGVPDEPDAEAPGAEGES